MMKGENSTTPAIVFRDKREISPYCTAHQKKDAGWGGGKYMGGPDLTEKKNDPHGQIPIVKGRRTSCTTGGITLRKKILDAKSRDIMVRK